ncbi:1795_t:CDS:2 [Diversispora eburnea]|uniref:1795_t:CDS:1 n=1 Tax=Diversispora eburnea TaxID=1213867 RepID=A0A9N8VRZ6_9GLOM|nr:1795_t:CDS:2 [Diversispora eburnea]
MPQPPKKLTPYQFKEGLHYDAPVEEERPQIVVLKEGRHLSEREVKDYIDTKSSSSSGIEKLNKKRDQDKETGKILFRKPKTKSKKSFGNYSNRKNNSKTNESIKSLNETIEGMKGKRKNIDMDNKNVKADKTDNNNNNNKINSPDHKKKSKLKKKAKTNILLRRVVTYLNKMAFSFINHLNKKRVVLASGSPRRKEILSLWGIKFEVVQSTFSENLDKSKLGPYDYVTETATGKGLEVYERLTVIIAADTVVFLDEEILEKPKDQDDAFRMLKKMNNRVHRVYTGVALIYPLVEPVYPGYELVTLVEETEITFRNNSDEILLEYIKSGESLDKAGAYGYQSLGCLLVKKINGCYYNGVGLPTSLFTKLEELFRKGDI